MESKKDQLTKLLQLVEDALQPLEKWDVENNDLFNYEITSTKENLQSIKDSFWRIEGWEQKY